MFVSMLDFIGGRPGVQAAAPRLLLQDLWYLNSRTDDVALALENSAQALTICAETQASLN